MDAGTRQAQLRPDAPQEKAWVTAPCEAGEGRTTGWPCEKGFLADSQTECVSRARAQTLKSAGEGTLGK